MESGERSLMQCPQVREREGAEYFKKKLCKGKGGGRGVGASE